MFLIIRILACIMLGTLGTLYGAESNSKWITREDFLKMRHELEIQMNNESNAFRNSLHDEIDLLCHKIAIIKNNYHVVGRSLNLMNDSNESFDDMFEEEYDDMLKDWWIKEEKDNHDVVMNPRCSQRSLEDLD